MTGVDIIAVAARTPVGLWAESSAAAVRAGISRIREHPFLLGASGEPVMCALDARLSPKLEVHERLTALLVSVFAETSAKLGQLCGLVGQGGIRVCFPEPRLDLDDRRAAEIVARLGGPAARSEILVHGGRPRVHMGGHAGGLRALERAAAEISQGAAKLRVVVAVDSYADARSLAWLDANGRLLRDGSRGGFAPGEAAVAIVLVSRAVLREHRLRSLAQLRSVSLAMETASATSAEGLQGVALSEALERVRPMLSAAGEVVSDVYIDINNERARATDWGFCTLRCGEMFADASAFFTHAESTGELGAASSLFNCLLSTRAMAHGYSRGPTALVVGASWAGLRGAALITTHRSS